MRILSFDPGGTTGVAIYDDEFAEGETPTTSCWARFELGPQEHHAELFVLLTGERYIVYETFDYQRRELDKGVSLVQVSLEYIGIIKMHKQYSEDGGTHVDVFPQKPAQRMFWTDEKLKRLGLWVSSPHERDATRHLLYHMTFTLNDQRFLYMLQ